MINITVDKIMKFSQIVSSHQPSVAADVQYTRSAVQPSGKDGWLSLKDLANLLAGKEDFQTVYARVRSRVVRGYYTKLKRGAQQSYIHINDDKIPTNIKIKYWSNNLSNDKIDLPGNSLELTNNKNDVNDELTGNKLKIALARADLIKLYIKAVEGSKSIVKDKKNFVETYNLNALPEIYSVLGKVSYKTMERWKKIYLDNNKDYRALAPGYKGYKTSTVPPQQAEILLKIVLNPNQPLISEAIRRAKDIFIMRNYTDIKSDATYRRFIEDWKDNNKAFWVFYREGEKGLNDKCLPYIERDYDVIKVGDIIVADGHTLNFEILNPFTGKPKRMTFILFYDMKSNFPLGWEIMPTENVQAISVALRRSIIRLGMYPKVVYLDNGKAFGAKYFKGIDFRTAGITGLFERLGIKVITAWPYHAQSKTVERFFGTFAELERMLPSYTGTSIEMKPARMNRGEKIHTRLHEKLYNGTTIDLITAHNAIAWWFDKYVQREQQDGHLKGLKPVDVFNEGKGQGVNKDELRFLMMEEKVTTIYRNGIKFLGTYYWHPELFGKENLDAVFRYDIIENDSIYIYLNEGGNLKYLCEAKRTDKIHPAAGILGTEEDVKKLDEAIRNKQMLKRSVVNDAKEFLKVEILPEAKRHLKESNIIDIDQKPKSTKEEKKQQKKKSNFVNKLSFEDEDTEQRINTFFKRAAEE